MELYFSLPGYTILSVDDKHYDYRVELKERREERGLTIAQLASLCNVSDQALYNIEKGVNDPSLSLLLKICIVLDIQFYELIDVCYHDTENDVHRVMHYIL